MQDNRYHPRVSVVIPALNEARNLQYVIPFLPSIVSEVILVDGKSTDDTVAIARKLLPTIRIVQQKGKGKGDALQTGFAVSTGDIIVMLDADGSTDPAEIPQMVDALLQGYDCVKGSRFLTGGGSHDLTPLRSIGNYGLCQLVNILYRARCSDLCYGYKAFWKRCIDYIDLNSTGFEVETLIYLRMHKIGFRIAEVPSIEQKRIYGQSHLRTFRDGWRVLKTIMQERGSRQVPALLAPQLVPPSPRVQEASASQEEVMV